MIQDAIGARLRPSGLFVLAVLCGCYAATMLALMGQWYSNQAYSYAFVVPLISAFVIKAVLERSPALPPSPDYLLGTAGIVLAMVMFVIGHLGSVLALQEVSLAIAVVACALFFTGLGMVRLLWFPLAYLFLMIPIWDRPIEFLHSTSQDMSARLATGILHFFDIPALRTDTLIILPAVTLEVARECSGINQLIAVFAIAAPASYLMMHGTVRRILTVVFALAVALVSNGVRIAAIGGGIYGGWISDNVHGPYHILQGLAVSCVGFAVIGLSLMFFANRPTNQRGAPAGGAELAQRRQARPQPALEFAVGLGVLAVATLPLWFSPVDVPLKVGFEQFPRQVGAWTETYADSARSKQVKVDGADDELVRSFRSENGQRVHLYVAYFRKQEQHREVVGAWTDRLLNASSPARVSIAPGDPEVEVNQVTRSAAGNASRTIFWFDINGKRAIDPYRVKLYSVVDAMIHRRTNGAVVIVSWDTDAGEATAELDSQRRAFLSAVFPLLTEYLPS